jgi:thiamine-phosphate pyrophosphorylase
MMQAKRFPRGLYGVTPDWVDAQQLGQAVRQAARGGMSALQLRQKTATGHERQALAQHLLTICQEFDIPLIINDDWQLAKAVGAAGVHLGRDDDDPAMVRQALGPDALLGVSCYGDLKRAQQMLQIGVDYVAFGAMFASGTKPQAVTTRLELLREARALLGALSPQTAVVAIGGITTDNATSVLQAGADSLAVVGGLFLSSDIEQTARQFSHLSAQAQSAQE